MNPFLYRLVAASAPGLLALGLGLICTPGRAAVTAELRPNPVLAGEVFTLTVRQSPAGTGEPQLPDLPQGLREIQRSQSQSTQIINGKVSSTRSWQIQMIGQEAGEHILQLPPLDGESFAPLALTVQKPDPQANASAEVFAQFITDDPQTWVGAEIRLRLQVYVAGDLESGRLPDPAVPGLVIEKISESNDGDALIGNTRYRVLDRQYVAFAEQAGELRIPGPIFTGQIVDRTRRSRFPSLSVPTRRVTAVAPDITIEVQAAQARPDAQWLPARAVVIEDSLEAASGQPRVQEALTRVIRLRVDGQLHTQLPDLQWPRPDRGEAQTYREDPQSQTGKRRDGGVSAELIQRFVHIPQNGGTLELPGVRLPWFNTEKGRWEDAQLPARQVRVTDPLPAQAPFGQQGPTAEPPQSPASAPSAPAASSEPSTQVPRADQSVALRWWQTAALAALAGWLFTLLGGAVWLWRKPRGPEVEPGPGRTSKLVAQAIRAQDAAALSRALHIWGREQGWIHAEDQGSLSLLGLAQALDPHPLGHQLRQLSRHLYAQAGWSPDSFAQAWAQRPHGPHTPQQKDPPALPELYPAHKQTR